MSKSSTLQDNTSSSARPNCTLAVIIATRHRPEPLSRCLESLAQQQRMPQEVLVVDSSEDHRSEVVVRALTSSIPNLAWHRSPIASAAEQRNFGAELVQTDIVLFLDDDVVLQPDFIDEIMAPFENCPTSERPAGVSGTISNQVYTDPRGLNRLLLGLCIGKLRGSYAGQVVGPAVNFLPEDRPRTIQKVDWLPTTCTAYDRKVFLAERFGNFEGYSFAEDVHLSTRVALKHRLVNTSSARVYHEDLGQHTHKDWFAIGKSQVVNRHLILSSILGQTGNLSTLRLFAYEMIYCPIAYLAAGASKERRRTVAQLVAGKWNGFRTIWRNG